MQGSSSIYVNGDRIYCNVNVRNNENNFQQLEYQEIRKAPFITQDVEKYDMAITRFSLDTNTIPLWIPHIQLDKTRNPTADPDQTIYTISITNATTDAVEWQEDIIWTPQNTGQNTPPTLVSQTTTQYRPPTITPYYYMNTIDHFVDLFNTTLSNASTSSVPTLTFDANIGKFSLWAGEEYEEGGASQIYNFYLNEPLYGLLYSFQAEQVNLNNATLHAKIPFKNLNTNLYEDDGSGNYEVAGFRFSPTGDFLIKMTQERGSLASFQVFRGVAFTTSMPIYYENTGATEPFGLSSNLITSSSDATSSIMCDQDCEIQDTQAVNQSILQYQPNFLHWITMAKARQLDTIQFRVFWKDTYGNLNPVFLRHGSISLKMIFYKARK